MSDKRREDKPAQSRWLMPLAGLVLSFLLLSPLTHADQLIVLSRQLDSYLQVAKTISAELENPSRIVTLAELEQIQYDTSGYQQVIAIGSKAADHLFDKMPESQPLYVSFIPRQTYRKLLIKYANHQRIKFKKVTAVYLDQPYERQIALARLIAPRAKSIATALGPNSQNDLELLKKAAVSEQLELRYEKLEETDNPIHKLQPLIRNSDIFLSLPDRSVFNRTTAKWVLYISFRQRIPLIGFSKKYVDAGALAAVHSTPEQIGRHTGELIRGSLGKKRLPAPQHPKYFSVATNDNAAQSLRIKIPTSRELESKLQELER